MRVYRLCRAAYRELDGEGARLYGGRWNSPGRPVVYASTSLALAALEYLIHVDPTDVPADLVALTIHVPDDAAAERVVAVDLPAGWEQVAEPQACKDAGDAWLEAARTLVLRVPSAPIPEEENVLLNVRHAAAARVRVVAERAFFSIRGCWRSRGGLWAMGSREELEPRGSAAPARAARRFGTMSRSTWGRS